MPPVAWLIAIGPSGSTGRARASTSLSMSVRSVIRPSTPRSSSASISVGVVDGPDVHVDAGRVGPAYQRRAWRPAAGPRRCGTCSAATRPRVSQPGEPAAGQHDGTPPPRPGAREVGDPAPVRRAERVAAGARENDPTQHPVAQASRSVDEVGQRRARRASALRSMLNRASGNSSSSCGQRRHRAPGRRSGPRPPRPR